MVIVADTSPINYLILIDQVGLLASLYGRVLIPPAVLAELKHALAPQPVQAWAREAPKWLDVVSPQCALVIPQLDLGKSEAIALAMEVHADVLLIDERAGRKEAVRRKLKVAGTLSVLDDADNAGLVNFDDVVVLLQNTSFRLSRAALAKIMRRLAR